MQIFILLGAPGVGKGTVAKVLCEGDDYYQLSTGQVFRDEIAAESELGLEVKGLPSQLQAWEDGGRKAFPRVE